MNSMKFGLTARDKHGEYSLVDRDKDPYRAHRGNWVSVSSQGNSYSGLYAGMSVEGILILQPCFLIEHSPGKKNERIYLYEEDKPNLISREYVIAVKPERKAYLDSLVIPLNQETLKELPLFKNLSASQIK